MLKSNYSPGLYFIIKSHRDQEIVADSRRSESTASSLANIAKREQPDQNASQPQRIPPNPIFQLDLGVFLLGFLPIRSRWNQNLRTASARSLKIDRPHGNFEVLGMAIEA
ncbi:MAG: hypothetical protein WCD53_08810 [Microcoleus sp.]